MRQSDFDQFADEYEHLHARNIRITGEGPEFFARYKMAELARVWERDGSWQAAPTVLDFGAGVGNSLPHLIEFFPKCRPICLDISKRSLEIAETRFPGTARFQTFDGNSIPLVDESVDLAFAACVFHHIDHDAHIHLLAEVRRVLKCGGMMLIFEHNPLNPLTVMAVNTCEFDRDARLIWPWLMRLRLKRAGYRDRRLGFCIFFPALLASLRRLEPYLRWLPLGAQYYVSGRKP